MEEDYFVMLTTMSGSYTPLMNSEGDDIARYKTMEEARTAANSSLLGNMYGWSIFDIADGED